MDSLEPDMEIGIEPDIETGIEPEIEEPQPEVKYESKEDIPLAAIRAENEEKKVLKYENGEILELKCADCNTPFPDGSKVKKNRKCENCMNQK